MSNLLIANMPEKMELSLTGYYITGTAVIMLWGGGTSAIKMESFEIDSANIESEEEFDEIIKSLLNDNGFGCERILGAYVRVYAKYTNNNTSAKVFACDKYIEKLEGTFTGELRELAFSVDIDWPR